MTDSRQSNSNDEHSIIENDEGDKMSLSSKTSKPGSADDGYFTHACAVM